MAAAKGNSLVSDIQEMLPILETERVKLSQCLINLLSNANKFTDQGTISLKVSALSQDNSDWIQFEVKDTGIGIQPEHLDKIFQVFTQADNETTRRYGGTGLGLSISQRLITKLGGSISVDSEYGAGTTFTFTLPQAQPVHAL